MLALGIRERFLTHIASNTLADIELHISGNYPSASYCWDESALNAATWALNLRRRGVLLLSLSDSVKLLTAVKDPSSSSTCTRDLLCARMMLPAGEDDLLPQPQRIRYLAMVLTNDAQHHSLLLFRVSDWLNGAASSPLYALYVDAASDDAVHAATRAAALTALRSHDFLTLASPSNAAAYKEREIVLTRLRCSSSAPVSRELCDLYVVCGAALLGDNQDTALLCDEFVCRVRDAVLLPMVRSLRAWQHVLLHRSSSSDDDGKLDAIQPIVPSSLRVAQLVAATQATAAFCIDNFAALQFIAHLLCVGIPVLDGITRLASLDTACRLCVILIPSPEAQDAFGSPTVNDIGVLLVGRRAASAAAPESLVAHWYSRDRFTQQTHATLASEMARVGVQLYAHSSLAAMSDSMNAPLVLLEFLGVQRDALLSPVNIVVDPVAKFHQRFYTRWFQPMFHAPAAASSSSSSSTTSNIKQLLTPANTSFNIAACEHMIALLWHSVCAQDLLFDARMADDLRDTRIAMQPVSPHIAHSATLLRGGMIGAAARNNSAFLCGTTVVSPTDWCVLVLPLACTWQHDSGTNATAAVDTRLLIRRQIAAQLHADTRNVPTPFRIDTSVDEHTAALLHSRLLDAHRAHISCYTQPYWAAHEGSLARLVSHTWTRALADDVLTSTRCLLTHFIEHYTRNSADGDANVMCETDILTAAFDCFCSWPTLLVRGRSNGSVASTTRETFHQPALRKIVATLLTESSTAVAHLIDDTYTGLHCVCFPVLVYTCSGCDQCAHDSVIDGDDPMTVSSTVSGGGGGGEPVLVSVDTAYSMALADSLRIHNSAAGRSTSTTRSSTQSRNTAAVPPHAVQRFSLLPTSVQRNMSTVDTAVNPLTATTSLTVAAEKVLRWSPAMSDECETSSSQKPSQQQQLIAMDCTLSRAAVMALVRDESTLPQQHHENMARFETLLNRLCGTQQGAVQVPSLCVSVRAFQKVMNKSVY